MEKLDVINVLIACEESQAVCIEMRMLGHNAFSCDVQECSGGHPEWHIMGDALPLINGRCEFKTMDGKTHRIEGRWDLLIAHPPCTYLTVTGNRYFNVERYGEKALQRQEDRKDAIEFFMAFANADCDKIAIENPVGVMSTVYRKPDQIIQPWQFGHPTTKSTCLWLKSLPLLIPTNIVEIDANDVYEYIAANGRIKHDSKSRSRCKIQERSKHRSKTFPGIARAIAEQWAGNINRRDGNADTDEKD